MHERNGTVRVAVLGGDLYVKIGDAVFVDVF